MSVTQRVSVITGGAQGIGKGIIKTLLETGIQCVCADIDEEAGEELISEYKKLDSLLFVQTDVSNPQQVENLVKKTLEKFGQVDSLINNAAISSPYSGPLEDLSLEVWNKYLAVNLTSPFLCSKYFIPYLKNQIVVQLLILLQLVLYKLNHKLKPIVQRKEELLV